VADALTPDDEIFYHSQISYAQILLPHLQCQIQQERKEGMTYLCLAFLDSQGIKWKIMPTLAPDGKLQGLTAQRRNRRGRQGFHSQCVREQATLAGLNALIRYIKQCEVYEQTQ
jgi:hypothetical protein